MQKTELVSDFLQAFGIKDVAPAIRDLIEHHSQPRRFQRREMLFHEDEEGQHLYYLGSGQVRLFRTDSEGRETVIRFVDPGEYFAEILLQLQFRYPVSAQALQPGTALLVDVKQLYQAMEQQPQLAMQLIAALTGRIKYLLGLISQHSTKDMTERFRNYLEELAARQGSRKVQLPAAKGEVALLLGTTPETFSRMLRKLQEEGYLRVEGRGIELLDF